MAPGSVSTLAVLVSPDAAIFATGAGCIALSLGFGGRNEVGHGEKITNEKSPGRHDRGSCSVATESTLAGREFSVSPGSGPENWGL
jgi:hypothetical protein